MKRFLTAIAAVTTIAGTALADGDEMKPVMTELKDGVYQFFMAHYSSLVVITDEGVLVVDPNHEFRSAAMRAEIAKLTDQPVVKVIYSHDHFDHSRGGQIFKAEGAEFIAHEGCIELMSRDLEKRVVMPDVTYSDEHRIELGDKVIELKYFGSSDCQCQSVIYMPEDKVLMGVDWHLPRFLVSNARLNTPDYVGALNTLRRVSAELDYDTVISGHLPKSSPELLTEELAFVEALYAAVWEGLQSGKSVDELKETIKLPEFTDWLFYEENLAAHVERMAFAIWHGH
ncbi:MBL fold metallo-hydrolase [uncultured Ruegeria sp.]|uniref:MBL fold metallo-hydrolase n=1 Tax=uncultured Ruegeria sp. TaxID=259304 RepID=UPI00262DD6F4|nr:MBL fold metallo-hydrolase [uncultured Ruegeria sp.]